jgi:anaerobic selenocysteine-containing dehydrogenase
MSATHFHACPFCEACCGLALTRAGDRVTRIRGNDDDVISRGCICPKVASLREVHEDGDRLRVAALGRAVEVQVEIDDSVMPGGVSLPHGRGHDLAGARLAVAAQRPGANANALASELERGPLSGNAVFNGIAVEVAALAS